ncbi:MAG TPA: hypothetical protein PKV50_03825 [Prolixibacteraceae bacterium]|nr:hypothetical protein [Bacteroidales bacterium]HPB05479.1 hypothetical protein [Prolixibacteraceae bacterium]HUM88634.1 hypothetical protein [Prolixibacteraceae bacterium]
MILKKRKDEIGTPSIMQALSGINQQDKSTLPNAEEKKDVEKQVVNQDFTIDQLLEIWPKFIAKYKDQIHLYNTLKSDPKLSGDYRVIIQVENSVQQDQIRLLKPEIIGFLQRHLNNSLIDVDIKMIEAVYDNKLLTDDQKLINMMKKNLSLQKMKNMFNLDFNS